MTDSRLPSGEQHEIRHGDQRAVIVEVGGGLRLYEYRHGPVLDGYAAQERCGGGRGQPLMPWPNRLRDGAYDFDGEHYELPLTERATATAIHGLVRWASWTATERQADHLVMGHQLYPQPGWPGTLDLSIEYQLGPSGLTVTAGAVNVGARACPFAVGFHPYLTLGTDLVDAISLRVPADQHLELDARGLPVAVGEVASTELDYRRPRPIGEARLDTCFTGLHRGEDGLARVELSSAERSLTLWADEGYGYLMVFTGDTLADSRRRQGLAVEPMSAPPNVFQSGQSLVALQPGQSFSARWGISPG